ncbi:hypothetical protein CHISP_1199 [Chitinispirillum alkaliphilum]|nr:hypothetical protein CHISP_1199 [Chitinispirillum alkaliphilum]
MSRYYPLVLLLLLARCIFDVSGNGSNVGNPVLTGYVYNKDGTPSNDAEVTLRSAEQIDEPKIAEFYKVDTTVFTDRNGKYTFRLPEMGVYSITIRTTSNTAALVEKVSITDTVSITLDPVKTRAYGKIHGVVQLNGTFDTIPIITLKLHLGYSRQVHNLVPFTLDSIPYGNYSIIFIPGEHNFSPVVKSVSVEPGKITNLDTIKINPGYTLTSPIRPSLQNSPVIVGDMITTFTGKSYLIGSPGDTAHSATEYQFNLGGTFSDWTQGTGIEGRAAASSGINHEIHEIHESREKKIKIRV